jgi:hypothetical protein
MRIMDGLVALFSLLVLGAPPLHAQQSHTPEAKSEAIVTVGEAWFTVLTNRLIRMGWDNDHTFENRATFVFIDRNLKGPLNLRPVSGIQPWQAQYEEMARANWKSLDFQPCFTATASNVNYGYWSHDIGRHTLGPISGEPYTRWVQLVIFGPIVCPHVTEEPDAERRFWRYDYRYSRAVQDAIHLRYRMAPHIYSMARHAYDTGTPITWPLYYRHPEVKRVYEFEDEYYFGDDLLVEPVTNSMRTDSFLAEQEVWLSGGGEWIEWFTGQRHDRGQIINRSFPLDKVPVYVHPGAVIPMQTQRLRMNEAPLDPLILTISPGGSDTTRAYQDSGNSLGYKEGKYAWTTVRHKQAGARSLRIKALPTDGSFPGMQEEQRYVVRLPRAWPPAEATYNGRQLDRTDGHATVNWHCDGASFTTIIQLPTSSVRDTTTVEATFPAPMDDARLGGMREDTNRLQRGINHLHTLYDRADVALPKVRGTSVGGSSGGD